MQTINVYKVAISGITLYSVELKDVISDLGAFVYTGEELKKLINDVSNMKINEIKEFSNDFIGIRVEYLEMLEDEFNNLLEFKGW